MSKNISRGATAAVAFVLSTVGMGNANAQGVPYHEIISSISEIKQLLSGTPDVEKANTLKLEAERKKIDLEISRLEEAKLSGKGCVHNIVNKVDYSTRQQYNVIAVNLANQATLRSNSIVHYESAVCNEVVYGIWAFTKGELVLEHDKIVDLEFLGNVSRDRGSDDRLTFSAPACSLARAKGSIDSALEPYNTAEASECENNGFHTRARPLIASGSWGAKHNSRTIAMIRSYARALVVSSFIRK